MKHLLPALVSLSLIFVAAPGLADGHVTTEVIGSCDVDFGAGEEGIGHLGLYTGHIGEPVPEVGIGGCSVFYDNTTEDNQEIVFAAADGCYADDPSDQGDDTSLVWFYCDTGVSGTNEVLLVTTLPTE